MEKETPQTENILDLWTRDKTKRFVKEINIGRMKTKKFFSKAKAYPWAQRFDQFKSTYHSHKAIFYGASSNLPFTTLTLLGECLSSTEHKEKTKKILLENVIKYDGEFLKLDLPDNQKRVRKALRTKQFNNEEKKQTPFSDVA